MIRQRHLEAQMDSKQVDGVGRWTVIGLFKPRGKYTRDTFVTYVGGVTAKQARDSAVETNAKRGVEIEVLACVSGGRGRATVFV